MRSALVYRETNVKSRACQTGIKDKLEVKMDNRNSRVAVTWSSSKRQTIEKCVKKSWTRVNKNSDNNSRNLLDFEWTVLRNGFEYAFGDSSKAMKFQHSVCNRNQRNFSLFFVLTKSKFCSVWCGDWDWLGRREREKRDYFMRWLLVSGIVTSLSLYSEWPPTQNHLCAKCWNSERFQMNWLDLGQARNSQFFQVV